MTDLSQIDATTPADTESTGTPDDAAPDDVTAIRELVLRAHPDVVPELITGETIDALLGSVEPARAAYRRLEESFRSTAKPETASVPPVPAGGEGPLPVDPERLPASEKIRRGLTGGRV